jgi:hypothetical protein
MWWKKALRAVLPIIIGELLTERLTKRGKKEKAGLILLDVQWIATNWEEIRHRAKAVAKKDPLLTETLRRGDTIYTTLRN